MQENSVRQGDRVKFSVRAEVGQHIRPRGQDVRSGDTLLEPGVSITPGVLGLLATFGQADVRVYQRPRVALLSTGDEVVLPGQPLGDAQIYSSNNAALAGMITQAGGVVIDFGNVPDDPATLANRFAEAASVADVVVSTGGVSVGDHDHVKDVLGDKIEFWRVAMKPGKPLAFGKIDGKPFFGLPGNPVSCMVNFLQFVRPALRTMLGDRHPFLPIVRAQMSRTLKRSTGRVELLRVQLSRENGTLIATPAGGHQGSGNVRSMAESHGLVMVAAEAETVWGEVSVQVFDFGFEARETPGYPWGAAEEK
jgi:molybdopterin molybdotransferase